MELAGLPSEDVLHDERSNLLGWWAPWLGVIGDLVLGADVSGFVGDPASASLEDLVTPLRAVR